MEKEFVPYKLAVKLNALGFDEPCIGYYHVNEGYTKGYAFCYFNVPKRFEDGSQHFINDLVAPTFSQAFRWFREECDLLGIPTHSKYTIMSNKWVGQPLYGNHNSYEEAELACLNKLIEIVESKSE